MHGNIGNFSEQTIRPNGQMLGASRAKDVWNEANRHSIELENHRICASAEFTDGFQASGNAADLADGIVPIPHGATIDKCWADSSSARSPGGKCWVAELAFREKFQRGSCSKEMNFRQAPPNNVVIPRESVIMPMTSLPLESRLYEGRHGPANAWHGEKHAY
jgi:hypothetical protein